MRGANCKHERKDTILAPRSSWLFGFGLFRFAGALLFLLQLQGVRQLHFLNDTLHQAVQITAFLIIGRTNIIYTVVQKQRRHLIFLPFLSQNLSSVLFLRQSQINTYLKTKVQKNLNFINRPFIKRKIKKDLIKGLKFP